MVSVYSLAETFVLILVILFGVPYNFLVAQLIQRRRKANKSAWLLLMQHLNAADMLILSIYVPLHIANNLASQWHAGSALCRIISSFKVFGFYAASNVAVCISIDRYRSCRLELVPGSVRLRFARRMLYIAWLMAVLCSIPQLVVYRVHIVNDQPQCADMWIEERGISNASIVEFFSVQNVYFFSHLLIIFWLPFFIILSCYGALFYKINKFAKRCVAGEEVFIQLTVAVALPHPLDKQHQVALSGSSKVLRVGTVLLLCYTCCWLPYNVVTLISYFQVTPELLMTLRVLAQFIVFNSLLNPFVYGACSASTLCAVSARHNENEAPTSLFDRFLLYYD